MYLPISISALTDYRKEEELPVDCSTEALSGNTDSADELGNTAVVVRELTVDMAEQVPACTEVDTEKQVPACIGVDSAEQVPVCAVVDSAFPACTGVGNVVVALADNLEGAVGQSLALVDILPLLVVVVEDG